MVTTPPADEFDGDFSEPDEPLGDILAMVADGFDQVTTPPGFDDPPLDDPADPGVVTVDTHGRL